jgi:hypothetical protein
MQVEVLFYPVRKIPKAWEMVELSSLGVCPMFCLYKRQCNRPSADFFEKLNRICYMWLPHSDGLYSPPDFPEPSLSDLFGSTTLAGSSIALVADGIARACMDHDSVETNTASVHVDLDYMVTSVCLGPDGMINSIS